MPTASTVMAELKSKGTEKTRKIYAKHGMAPDRAFGVSVADMKEIAKSIKAQQGLACELLDTGNLDAMYMAGMVADGRKLTPGQLTKFLENAEGLQMVGEYTIPWLAVENPKGRELALQWIGSKKEHVAAAGWCTYSGIVTTQADSALDLEEIRGLLDRVVNEIGSAPNRARHCMNNFVIAVGTYVAPLLGPAKEAAKQIGKVEVDMGETACKVPDAFACIEKAEATGRVGKKRKTIRC